MCESIVAAVTYITASKGKVKIRWEEAMHKIPVYDSH